MLQYWVGYYGPVLTVIKYRQTLVLTGLVRHHNFNVEILKHAHCTLIDGLENQTRTCQSAGNWGGVNDNRCPSQGVVQLWESVSKGNNQDSIHTLVTVFCSLRFYLLTSVKMI